MITCHFWGETVTKRNFLSMASGFHFKFEMNFEKRIRLCEQIFRNHKNSKSPVGSEQNHTHL